MSAACEASPPQQMAAPVQRFFMEKRGRTHDLSLRLGRTGEVSNGIHFARPRGATPPFTSRTCMSYLKASSCYAVAAALLGVVACSTAGDGSTRFAPTGPALDVSVTPQTAQVCKTGPVGNYSFTVSNTGTTNTGDVLVAAPSIEVTDPSVPVCTTVFTRSQYAGGAVDAAAIINIVEDAAPGTVLTSVSVTGNPATAPATDLAARSASFGVNAFHTATANFVNEAVVLHGCTYTQGWYKNHTSDWPAGFSPNDQFYSSGLSWIDLYNTPPKGSQYIILAHQYMTALMNASGATVPADVQAAMDAAETYFSTGSGDITGVAGVLDEYNNGLADGGPAHCE
ncbi:MAG TPA: hypothetical protein VFP90_18305 [Gemmatimonadaceae bacterium]|nr:hypothetical protein [Gemmatimonadaceae bacterium]